MNCVINNIRAILRPVFGWKRRKQLRQLLERCFPKYFLYDRHFYDRHDRVCRQSAEVMAADLFGNLKPQSVVDVGCGDGWLLDKLRAQGCHRVQGYEYSAAGLRLTRQREIAADRLDLRQEIQSESKFDLCTCFEVAEHIEAQFADTIVRNLVKLAPVVVFSAAIPGQGGVDHVNEQPNSYWIERFIARGMTYDEATTAEFRQRWQANPEVAPWYGNNVMVFRRDG